LILGIEVESDLYVGFRHFLVLWEAKIPIKNALPNSRRHFEYFKPYAGIKT